jgi:hypothetical protein
MTNDPNTEKQGEGNRPNADGPKREHPPARPSPPRESRSPEKSRDVHGGPEPPA